MWDKCVCVCAFCTYVRSFSFITRRFRQPYLKKKSSLLTVLFFPFLSHRMTPQPRNYWHGSLSFDSLPRRLNWGSRRKKKAKKRDYLFIKPHRFTFITSILLVAAILRFLKKKETMKNELATLSRFHLSAWEVCYKVRMWVFYRTAGGNNWSRSFKKQKKNRMPIPSCAHFITCPCGKDRMLCIRWG